MKLGMKEYQRLAQRTSPDDGHDRIDNAILGMIGETGEIVDIYKKWMYQSVENTALPGDKLADELGDVLWYMAELAAGMDMDLIDIIGEDFVLIDDKIKRKPAKRTSLRNAIVGLSGRANALNREIARSGFRAVNGHLRRMMLTMAHLAQKAGYTLEEVAMKNIDKLKKRYPDGFDARKSMERYE